MTEETLTGAARAICIAALASVFSFFALPANAQDDGCDASCQAARKAQDPLAPIAGVLTDFTSTFGPGNWSSGSRNDNYQFQPVYSLENLGGSGSNLIFRGIVPVNSVPDAMTGSRTTGIGDTLVQAFYVPSGQLDGGFKLGFGPQISVPTRTDDVLAGPGWGAGAVLVGFGGAGALSYGGILGHLWGENSSSNTLINPIVFYNWSLFGGSYIGYSNSITYDWKAVSGDRWNVPVGLTLGKAFTLNNGSIIDANIGFYSVSQRASGAGDRQFKWAISWLLP